MELNKLLNDQLLVSLEQQFATERSASHSILLHLKEIRARRLHAERGFPNLFSMLVHHFHQSETAANQRLKALDLMLAVSVVEERLISGDLNLSTVAMAQRQILREEKLTGKKVSGQKKTVPDDVRDMMTRLKELWAHVDPSMDNVEVMRRAFKLALAQVDPTQKKKTQSVAKHCATESVKHRSTERLNYYGKEFDRALWERAGSRCEYVDEKTGRRCDCKFGLQREHVIPLAKGGTNEFSNMQLLCAAHNQLRARKAFGNSKIDAHQARARDQDDRGQRGV